MPVLDVGDCVALSLWRLTAPSAVSHCEVLGRNSTLPLCALVDSCSSSINGHQTGVLSSPGCYSDAWWHLQDACSEGATTSNPSVILLLMRGMRIAPSPRRRSISVPARLVCLQQRQAYESAADWQERNWYLQKTILPISADICRHTAFCQLLIHEPKRGFAGTVFHSQMMASIINATNTAFSAFSLKWFKMLLKTNCYCCDIRQCMSID